jgi:outer membrane protein assembly factor BamA
MRLADKNDTLSRAAWRGRGAALPVAFGLVAATLGCASIPEGRSAVDDVTVRGASQVSAADLEDVLATTPSAKLFGLFRGVAFDYEIYDYTVLQRDLARVERFYRARGYYDAHARAGRVATNSTGHVSVEIVVDEGEPVKNHDLVLRGLEGLPPEIGRAVTQAVKLRLPTGDAFDEKAYEAAEADARKALTDRGYAYARVERDVFVDVVRHTADVSLAVSPDKPAKFGKVTFEGLEPDPANPRRPRLPEAPLRRAVDIDEGSPYSTAAIESATRALLDLEVLSSVEVTPVLTDPPPEPRVVAVHIKVEPSQLRQWTLGGGLELDQLKTDLHGVIGWEDHDFLGGLRDFTVELKPGVVLYPTRIDNLVAPNSPLPEAKLRLQLRQPGFIEARTHGFIRPEINVFPLLVKTSPAPDDPVVGYGELKVGAGADRTFGRFFASISHNVQVEAPFPYKGPLDPALKTLLISYPSLKTTLDFRDDRIHTHKGIYLSNELQVAGGPFGGDATDIKVQPEVRTYLPLGKHVTFATRASVGFLLPSSYGDVVENRLADRLTDANRAERVRDIETVFFRGFFSGGATSNRGYPIRGIAPHGVVPFLNPQTASQQVALRCDPSAANNFSPDPAVCSIAIGGFTLWELSNELRFAVSGPLHAATFCDMSDVSPHPGNIRLTHLHLSCGVGVRYETPVGPIRLDIGYRIQPAQVLGFASEQAVARSDPTEGTAATFLGVPIALAFGIGEAY